MMYTTVHVMELTVYSACHLGYLKIQVNTRLGAMHQAVQYGPFRFTNYNFLLASGITEEQYILKMHFALNN